jgi:2-(1,2-epoxy-1,2-dihydrophenyl)acetyl-CoA isomerase
MTRESVLFEIVHHVAVVTLNEGERMNPLTEGVQAGLLDAMERVREETSIRAMLLTARGRGFCVGADLKDFSRRAADLPAGDSLGRYVGRMMENGGNAIVQGLSTLPVPVVCAVNGAAAGGGFGVALAADVVIAARSAIFYLPFVPALGIVPDMGAAWALTRSIGRARAVALTLLGEKLSAEKAAQWGMIWDCVDDEDLTAEAMQIARRLAELPGHAIHETRALFDAAETNDLASQLALERERQERLIDGESFAEGMRAFGERRKPVFRGR